MNKLVGYFYAVVALLAAFGAAIHSADVIVEYQSGFIPAGKVLFILFVMAVVIAILTDFAVTELEAVI